MVQDVSLRRSPQTVDREEPVPPMAALEMSAPVGSRTFSRCLRKASISSTGLGSGRKGVVACRA